MKVYGARMVNTKEMWREVTHDKEWSDDDYHDKSYDKSV